MGIVQPKRSALRHAPDTEAGLSSDILSPNAGARRASVQKNSSIVRFVGIKASPYASSDDDIGQRQKEVSPQGDQPTQPEGTLSSRTGPDAGGAPPSPLGADVWLPLRSASPLPLRSASAQLRQPPPPSSVGGSFAAVADSDWLPLSQFSPQPVSRHQDWIPLTRPGSATVAADWPTMLSAQRDGASSWGTLLPLPLPQGPSGHLAAPNLVSASSLGSGLPDPSPRPGSSLSSRSWVGPLSSTPSGRPATAEGPLSGPPLRPAPLFRPLTPPSGGPPAPPPPPPLRGPYTELLAHGGGQLQSRSQSPLEVVRPRAREAWGQEVGVQRQLTPPVRFLSPLGASSSSPFGAAAVSHPGVGAGAGAGVWAMPSGRGRPGSPPQPPLASSRSWGYSGQ